MNYSIVVPMFNEEGNVDEFCIRLSKVLDKLDGEYEVIFVDDGSNDATFVKLYEWSNKNQYLKIVRLSRNFGHQLALTAGIDMAKGNAVIIMDGDLQHPPELIPEMIGMWQKGVHVVNTIRKDTAGASLLKKIFASCFYKLINLDTEVPILSNSADFKLMDRVACDSLKQLREQDRFMRGMTSWIGFRQGTISYIADERFSGSSKYTFLKMLKFAINGITSFTTLPLKTIGYLGCLIAIVSFFYASYAIYEHLVLRLTVTGWTSLLICVLFIGGVQLVSVGVLGAYIAKVYRQVKQRPLYLIQDKINI